MARGLPVLIMTAGASVLALWLWVRLGELRPHSLRSALVHAVLAVAALNGVSFAMGSVVGEDPSRGAAMVGLLAMFLPAMTYAFLASLYVLEQIQRRLYAAR
jgi:hypothetical protein